MKPWLSVVMPVHLGATYLEATLASVAAETPQGVEFQLYDSGDDQGAARRIAERYADRIELGYRATPEIVSWTAKTNLGVKEARATHVCMLHQDDLWLPGHLTAVRTAIERDPQAAMSIGGSRFIGPQGRLLGSWRLPFNPGSLPEQEFLRTLLVQNTIAIPSPVIRRDAWLACGGMDDALWYTADWDLYLKLARHGAVAVRPEATTAFRLHAGSLTMSGRRNLGDFRRQHELVLERHLGSLAPTEQSAAKRRARASIAVNCLLAAVSAGKAEGLFEAVGSLARLGLRGTSDYLRQSRLIDRLAPRLRLAFSGSF